MTDIRDNDYIKDNGNTDYEFMQYDYLHGINGFKKHKLSDILTEMGFPEHSFMTVREWDNPVKVADSWDEKGYLKENPYLTFGGYHLSPDDKTTTYQGNDNYMKYLTQGDKFPNGGIGFNNGIYAAQAFGGKEIIITKDPRIAAALVDQLSFKEGCVGVPLSNGGTIMDSERHQEWEKVKLWGENVQKHIREGDKDKLPEPKRLDISGEYEKIKTVQKAVMQSKMNAGRY